MYKLYYIETFWWGVNGSNTDIIKNKDRQCYTANIADVLN